MMEEINGRTVIAKHDQITPANEKIGVVLLFDGRSYSLHTTMNGDTLINGRYDIVGDERAWLLYSEKVMDMLYGHHNMVPPKLVFPGE
jgi:hypothetical protein